MSYTVIFKKVFTGIEQNDEGDALEDAEHKLGMGLANKMCTLDEFFQSFVQKEPVKEIIITEDSISQFLEDNFEGVELTEKQVKDFMDFLEADVTEFMKANLRCFLKEE